MHPPLNFLYENKKFMTIIIGLVGRKQVGKDTVANYLQKRHGFKQYAFASPLKKACQVLYQLTEEQVTSNSLKEVVDTRWGKTPRQIMQYIGTDIFRTHVDPDFWIRHFRVWLADQGRCNIVVSDCRFQNEVDAVRDAGGIILHIRRNNNHHHGTTDGHASEQDHNIQNISYTVYNNGTLDSLYAHIEEILTQD